MEEYFKPIKDYETYAVSNYGNVKDIRSGKLISLYETNGGYLRCSLLNPNGYSKKLVSRLVGETFIENLTFLPEIDHIDRNRKNNNVNNLRWVSKSDNVINSLYTDRIMDLPRYIHYDAGGKTKQPYSCWRIQARNQRLYICKRFRTDKYNLEEVIKIRNEILKEKNIPIND